MVLQINLDDTEKLKNIGKAFSSDVRIELMKLLCNESLNVNEISERLDIPASSAAMHVKVLEDAGLIKSDLMPASRGSMKLCKMTVSGVEIVTETAIGADKAEVINMPIGAYVDYKVDSVNPTCGIAGEKGHIGQEDKAGSFYHQDRGNAGLLWFGGAGYVEYRFPTYMIGEYSLKRLEVSAEVCSEDHEYNLDFPSDISLYVNEKKVGAYECPSDFGGRRGMWNPSWWPDKNTQYGKLVTWSLRPEGCFVDDKKSSTFSLKDFDIEGRDYISVRISVDPDAKHVGGLNLFGDGFGDFAQGIRMTFYKA